MVKLKSLENYYENYVYLCVKSLQSCLTLCQTITHEAPLSMGIFQARILEWVAVPSSRGSSQPRNQIQVP